VLSYLPGGVWSFPRDLTAWTAGLAQALMRVHAITPELYELDFLPPKRREELRAGLERKRADVADAEPLAGEVLAALEASLDGIELLPPCLVHDDYFPGNTVWYRGRMRGIIDWTDAVLGDPRMDVGQCRLDLVVSHGAELADAFLADYELASGVRLDMRFFDLYYGLFGLLYFERYWLKGYHDAGLTHLTPEDVGARLREFVRRALNEKPQP
jgi:aminoglycoside phosphotransferase (APT) family kinase protein